MLRSFTLLLISIISVGWLVPAMLAPESVSLPACCRQHGKHHCAMKMLPPASSQRANSAATIAGLYEKCPYSSRFWTSVSNTTAFALHRGELFFAAAVSHPAAHAQTEARYRISFSRSWQKRGPPFFLFS